VRPRTGRDLDSPRAHAGLNRKGGRLVSSAVFGSRAMVSRARRIALVMLALGASSGVLGSSACDRAWGEPTSPAPHRRVGGTGSAPVRDAGGLLVPDASARPAIDAGIPGRAEAGSSASPPRSDASSGFPLAGASSESPPTLPADRRRACERDSDCTFVDRPCTCPPCGEVWREVLNKKAAQQLQDSWARRRCRAPRCPPCSGRQRGTRAVCANRQCAVR